MLFLNYKEKMVCLVKQLKKMKNTYQKIILLSFFICTVPVVVFADSVDEQVEVDRMIEIISVQDAVLERGVNLFVGTNGEKKQLFLIGVDMSKDLYNVCSHDLAVRELNSQLTGSSVDIVTDGVIGKTRDNGALYRYVRLRDGMILNERLIREGYYYVDRSVEFDQKEKYLKLETEARNQKKGVWGSRLSCEVQSFLSIRNNEQGEVFLLNMGVYQLLQYISLALLLLVLSLIAHFWSRGSKK